MKTAISKNGLYLSVMPTIHGIAIKTLDDNKIENTITISWTSILNNAAYSEDTEKINPITANAKNSELAISADINNITITAYELDTTEHCGIKINWKELIEDCIKNKIENDVYAMQMRNNENNTLTVIKRRTEIENTTIGEEDMKTNATEIHITPGMIPTTEEDNELTEMGELQETINMLGETIQELNEDEELKKLIEKVETAQKKVDEKRNELGIPSIEEEKAEYTSLLNTRVNEFASSIDDARWGPNQFTKGKKKEFSSKNGVVSILKSTRTVRKINTKKLLDINPLFIQKLAEEGRLGVTLAEAEKDMSKNEIDEVADKTVTATYELYVKTHNR